MKKILIAFALLMICSVANATTLKLSVSKEAVVNLNKIGYKILNSNRIPYNMNFVLLDKDNIGIHTNARINEIKITDEFLKYLESDDEIAAVLAHEISHGVDNRTGILRGAFSSWGYFLSPKKYDYKADKRSVDYLVKAGYNPLATIIVLNKMVPQTRFDWHLAHPTTSRRMAEIYEYIYNKYPQYLVQNEYKDNYVYQNFLLTSKENRAKLEEKIKNNSRRKVNYL